MAVSSWSTSAGSNTSVGGVNIAESMARADVNNAIRAVMAEAKAKFDQAINVDDHNAVGDGVTDDTSALAAAFAAAIAAAAPLSLTRGKTYLTTAQISITAGLTVFGNKACIKAKNSAAITGALLRASAISNIVIKDLELDCNAANTGANYGIWLTGGSGHLVDNCYVHDSHEAGIALEELTKSRVVGGRVITCGRNLNVSGGAATNNHGIMIFTDTNGTDISDIEVTGVYVDTAYRKGITTYSGGTGVVSNVDVHDNICVTCGVTAASGGGIYAANAGGAAVQQRIKFHNNILKGNYVNFEIADVDGGSATGNVVSDSVAQGVSINGIDNFVFTSNEVKNSGTHGIACTTSSGTNSKLVIVGNEVMRSNRSAAGFGAGIWLNNTISSTIVGNDVDDDDAKMTHGIIEQGTSADNLVFPNRVLNATSANFTIISTSPSSGAVVNVATSYNVAGTKVIGARETGWTAGTGTANKGAFATYAGQNVSVGYVEAEAQATDDAVKADSQRIKAIEDSLRTHGLIN